MKLPLERQELIGASRQDQKRASRTIPANDFSRFQSISVTSDDANVCTQVKDTPVKDTPVKDAQVKDAQAKDTQVKDTTFGSP